MVVPLRARLLLTGVMAFFVVLGLTRAGASSANISHSYKSQDSLSTGNLVSLDAKIPNSVQAATVDNGARLLGVIVAKNDSLLAIDEQAGAVQVATNGNAKALVTTINGAIAVGDQIAVSPFSGIGMKATPSSRVIGLAQNGFSTESSAATSQEVTDKNGKKQQIAVGYVSVSIAVGNNSSGNVADNLTGLQKLGKSITGHTVSSARVVISMIVALVALCSLITLIYASIYGGIISVGRNPLAKYAVYRTIGSVMGMVAITAAIAGVTIFLLLR